MLLPPPSDRNLPRILSQNDRYLICDLHYDILFIPPPPPRLQPLAAAAATPAGGWCFARPTSPRPPPTATGATGTAWRPLRNAQTLESVPAGGGSKVSTIGYYFLDLME